MATYTDFKTEGFKGQSSLDALFIVKTEVDCTEQELTQDDYVELCDLAGGVAVIGFLLYGTGEQDSVARNVQIGVEDDDDAIVGNTDIDAENLNVYSAGSGFYLSETDTIRLKAITDATYDTAVFTVALVCVQI